MYILFFHIILFFQNYYDHLDKAIALSMIEELNKLVELRREKTHSLAQPIPLEQYGILIPPLQFTRFPTLR